MYIEFIRDAIRTDGWRVTDIANKLALESEQITLDQYRAAARIIANAYLESTEE
jgi:hypothetical protein